MKSPTLIREKAEAGDAVSQNALGEMYLYGKGVKEDYCEAVKWFRKAAEQNFLEAQYQIGLFYFFGDGVEENHSEAYAWFNLSAQNGYNLGVKRREELEKTLKPEQLSNGKKRTKELKTLIAEKRLVLK